jgi:aspartate carbamoyltransferase catalytic subunit
MLRHRKTLHGLRVTITGDILHSRVARSNVHLLTKFGAKVTLCGPSELLPEVAATLAPGVRVERDFDKALRAADVIMMLRVQKERLAGLNLDLEKYTRGYQLTAARVRLAMKNALVMHPGPVMRGIELTSEVMDGPQSVIFEQAANGVFVRMALLERALR